MHPAHHEGLMNLNSMKLNFGRRGKDDRTLSNCEQEENHFKRKIQMFSAPTDLVLFPSQTNSEQISSDARNFFYQN